MRQSARQSVHHFANQDPFEAVWSADYDRALAVLHGATMPGASAMRVRAYHRMDLLERVFEEFRSERFERLQPREAAEVASTAAVAYARAARNPESAHAATVARELARAACDPLLDVQLANDDAICEILHGRLDHSEAKTAEAFELLKSRSHVKALVPYGYEVNHLRARILDFRRLHAVWHDDPVQQERFVTEAIACATRVLRRDYWIEAGLLLNLSVIVYRYDSAAARALLRNRSAMIRWQPHLDSRSIPIQGALRTSDLLYAPAPRVARPDSPKSATLAWRVTLCVKDLLYGDWDDRERYERELSFAIEIAQVADWNVGIAGEFLSLVELTTIVASFDFKLAEKFRSCYRLLLKSVEREICPLSPGFRIADEEFMDGCIAKARGDTAGAVACLGAASAYFNEQQVPHRAAIVGLERYTLTCSVSDLVAAEAFLQCYADTPFAHRLCGALERAKSGASYFPYFDMFPDAQVGALGTVP